ncbi:hypothetical protein BC939DRAFT_438690 [Gamsiella multidivaricata]|uniref:uncharacterized protein n=1 Tax=Gamsiella multidivaricata TaxID=101098 RepID=UPI00221F4A88|nr:uncharacterized protein BC939DRAFT_438690 [Gamsiella multidivaricata]KAI7830666.1 hypothetical protein BC939DRAFT_438690 [Gamsiella multidivaricata]
MEAMRQCILCLEEEAIETRIGSIRKWKDTYDITLRRTRNVAKARDALRDSVEASERSSLRRLFLHGCENFSNKLQIPLSEADQTSSYILPMLGCIMTQPKKSRLAHTASTPTSGSLFVRMYRDLQAPPKHPDLIVKHTDANDISFGEVSFSSDSAKDTGDFCRNLV